MATGRREVAFAEATNGRSQHIFRKLEFAEPAQFLDRSLRSEAVVANPKYAGKSGLSEAIPNRVVDEWEIANSHSKDGNSGNASCPEGCDSDALQECRVSTYRMMRETCSAFP